MGKLLKTNLLNFPSETSHNISLLKIQPTLTQKTTNSRWKPGARGGNQQNQPGGNQQRGGGITGSEGPEPRVLSKKRRDLINSEIRELQNLLPLKKSSRERLSYLGILALTNTYIRKATFFNNIRELFVF